MAKNLGVEAIINPMDTSEDRAVYKNLMSSGEQNGIAMGRHDASGGKVESRGSRRSVVFSKIKNPV